MPEIKKNYSLKNFNTFGLDVTAKSFVEVHSIEDLKSLKSNGLLNKDEILILGGGSNVLFTKDPEELIIHIDIQGIEILREDNATVTVKVGAGVSWHSFVMWSIENNLSGIENLSLIPGTCGAAPMQNIGAYGAELVQVFDHLEAFHIGSSEIHRFDASDCEFGYRESVFKHRYKRDYIICSVCFQLKKQHSFNISYGDIQQVIDEQFEGKITLRNVSDAVIFIRQSKLPDPAKIGNSGSFFKNPIISEIQFIKLKEKYPNLPSYPAREALVKVPAGWLIDQAGWKGYRRGEIGVHAKQALVLVNYGGGSGKDILQLAQDIQNDIAQKFGISLQTEVNIL